MPDIFHQRERQLWAEDVPLQELAERYGTPLYVYSRAALEAGYRAYADVPGDPPQQIRYSVKANGNLAVLNVLTRLGAGFDVVSGGELERVRKAGGDTARVVFSGVGKSDAEMRRALELGIACFNVESPMELRELSQIAVALGVEAPVAWRINPDIEAGGHPHIQTGRRADKFGVPIADARALYRQARDAPGIRPIGVACHLGSQLLDFAPLLATLDSMLALCDTLGEDGIALSHINIGGGLGVRYRDGETTPRPQDFLAQAKRRVGGRPLALWLEPGRSIAAPAGALLTRVRYLKENKEEGARSFAVVDAAMNDLLRPALYQAWHRITAVTQAARPEAKKLYDIVGPVCESADCLGSDRWLSVAKDSIIAIHDCGAYGFSMASHYNSRPKPAEVMVDGGAAHLIRAREKIGTLWQGEALLPS